MHQNKRKSPRCINTKKMYMGRALEPKFAAQWKLFSVRFAAKWMKPIQFWWGLIWFVILFTSTDRTGKQIQFENLNIASSLLEPQRTSRTIIGHTKQKQIEGTSSVPCDFHRNKNIPTSIRTCVLYENEIHARGVWSHLRKLPREKWIKVLIIKHERLHQFWTCIHMRLPSHYRNNIASNEFFPA